MTVVTAKVTVYVTTKNRIVLLKRCIQSIQTQTYENIEIIVSDDGSDDGTVEFLVELQKQGCLTAIINKESKGACAARNEAITIATGEFITGIDDDDYMEPWRIKSFVDRWINLVKNSNSRYAGLFDDTIVENQTIRETVERPDIVSYADLRKQNLIGNQVFTKTDNLQKAGMFDISMPALQDWETWLRMASLHGGFLNIHTASYVQDIGHDAGRITQKKRERISHAFNLIEQKIGAMTFSERAAFAETKYSYPQLRLTMSEIMSLFLNGKIRKSLSSVKKRIFS